MPAIVNGRHAIRTKANCKIVKRDEAKKGKPRLQRTKKGQKIKKNWGSTAEVF